MSLGAALEEALSRRDGCDARIGLTFPDQYFVLGTRFSSPRRLDSGLGIQHSGTAVSSSRVAGTAMVEVEGILL